MGSDRVRILVCEFVTGGGMAEEPFSADLFAEAEGMAAALVQDLTALDGVQVLLCRDARLGPMAGCESLTIGAGDPVEAVWAEGARRCDAVWPIGPETGGVLERMVALFAATGRPVLAPEPSALAVAASKWASSERLRAAGLPAVPTVRLGEEPPPAERYVVKPDDGAGTVDTFILGSAELAAWTPPSDGAWAVQPLVEGDAASFSMLVGADGRARLLACNRQRIRRLADRFESDGVTVGALAERRDAWKPLAQRVADALPGLRGYVGVDLIDGPDGPVLLEVNPRLTASYIGLSAALGENVAGRVLADLLPDCVRMKDMSEHG
ncbi:ATP-grasp domain-containing protein [Azospirillum sp. SYSU D00513]|uniref:ATP-grasp domain-containing protein n=1 Tax=Azospirillum sp. SYSU D00513 TaxID=2812561 RepID=UPI001A970218|nr:ATP-grasp domain-containing protein [Azospirillum sp. SYSU D00513]